MTAQLNNDRSDDLCFFLSQLMLGGEHHHEVPSIVESVYKPDYSYNPKGIKSRFDVEFTLFAW